MRRVSRASASVCELLLPARESAIAFRYRVEGDRILTSTSGVRRAAELPLALFIEGFNQGLEVGPQEVTLEPMSLGRYARDATPTGHVVGLFLGDTLTALAEGEAPASYAAVVSRIEGPSAQRGTGEAALVPTAEVVQTSTLLVTGAASRVAPNILSLAHWDRRLGGALYAPLSRPDWATLLRRTFDVDVLRCHGCGGRMTVRAVVTDAAAIARLLGTSRPSGLAARKRTRRARTAHASVYV